MKMKRFLSCEIAVIALQIGSILIDSLTLWTGVSALSNAISYMPEIPLPACIAVLTALYVIYNIFFRNLFRKNNGSTTRSSSADIIASLSNRVNILIIAFILNLIISFLS